MHWIGLHNFIGDLLNFLNFEIFERIAIDQSFSDGFYWGLGLALAVGFIGRIGVYFWGRLMNPIRVFFATTRLPASNPGPSPASKLGGCMGSMLLIAFLIAAIVWFAGNNAFQAITGG